MNHTAQQLGKAELIRSKQVATDSTTNEPTLPKPVVVAGTSEGLWFLGSEQHRELEGHSVTAIASSSDGLWVIIDRSSVWHRNAANEWCRVAAFNDLRLNCILPIDQVILVGTSEAHLLRIAEGNVERMDRFDRAEGRDQWYTPWGGPPDVRSMAADQAGKLFVNVHVGGILRSDNQGQSWCPTIDFHADVHEVRTVPDHPDLVLAATAEGLAMSPDSGESWSFDQANLHAVYSRAVAVCREVILMTASLGPHGGKAAIYRRLLDQPGSFEKCERGLPDWFSDNINTRCLATSGDFAAFGTSDGQIFVSDDAGLMWKQMASGLAPVCCLTLLVSA